MKKTLFVVLALFFAFSLTQSFAQVKSKKDTTTQVAKKDKTKKSDSNVKGEKLICPVMNMEAKKEINYTYKGKKYYFCCKDCLAKFKANPKKYATK
jgi:YHS domain-containing protein